MTKHCNKSWNFTWSTNPTSLLCADTQPSSRDAWDGAAPAQAECSGGTALAQGCAAPTLLLHCLSTAHLLCLIPGSPALVLGTQTGAAHKKCLRLTPQTPNPGVCSIGVVMIIPEGLYSSSGRDGLPRAQRISVCFILAIHGWCIHPLCTSPGHQLPLT